MAEFGNTREKTARYEAFWNRRDVKRPLDGFSLVGWFPFREFPACRTWKDVDYLTPDMVDPEEFLADHVQPVGRMIAAHYDNPFIHLHSTSSAFAAPAH